MLGTGWDEYASTVKPERATILGRECMNFMVAKSSVGIRIVRARISFDSRSDESNDTSGPPLDRHVLTGPKPQLDLRLLRIAYIF